MRHENLTICVEGGGRKIESWAAFHDEVPCEMLFGDWAGHVVGGIVNKHHVP